MSIIQLFCYYLYNAYAPFLDRLLTSYLCFGQFDLTKTQDQNLNRTYAQEIPQPP